MGAARWHVAALLGLQSICAVFFIGDVLLDIGADGVNPHRVFETAIALVSLFIEALMQAPSDRR
jgi:hypothetical protein